MDLSRYLLGFAIVLLLAGCGGGSEDSPSDDLASAEDENAPLIAQYDLETTAAITYIRDNYTEPFIKLGELPVTFTIAIPDSESYASNQAINYGGKLASELLNLGVDALVNEQPVETSFSNQEVTITISEYGRFVVSLWADHSILNNVTLEFRVGPECTGAPSIPNINQTTSYFYQQQNFIETPVFENGHITHAFFDIDGDSDLDILVPTMTYGGETNPLHILINDGDDNFEYGDITDFVDVQPDLHHPRKILIQDFNGDSILDFFILDHGYERLVGEIPYDGINHINHMYLSQNNGSWKLETEFWPNYDNFSHGGAAGDIDQDGDIDIIMSMDNTEDKNAGLFRNDGTGVFTYEPDIFSEKYQAIDTFNWELWDVNQDGFLDLVGGSHQEPYYNPDHALFNIHTDSVFWGGSECLFSYANSTKLPFIRDYGALIQYDFSNIDNDEDYEIFILRTGDEQAGFGFYNRSIVEIADLTENGFVGLTDKVSDQPNMKGQLQMWVSDINDDTYKDIITHTDEAGASLYSHYLFDSTTSKWLKQ